MASSDPFLTGGCGCGAVRFALAEPFASAGFCHCTRCQRRTGTAASPAGSLPASALTVAQGAERLRAWRPEGGWPKWFCSACGGHLFAGEIDRPQTNVGVRLGALDGDPGIRPQYHQWTDSAPAWDTLPDDGLPRYGGPRPG